MDKKGKRVGTIIFLIIILIVIVLFLILIWAGKDSSFENGPKLPDPSIDYCKNAGHNMKTKMSNQDQYTVCIFPDGSECDTWAYFCGCTNDSRYCVRKYPKCDYPCR